MCAQDRHLVLSDAPSWSAHTSDDRRLRELPVIDNFVVSPTDPTATGALFELGRLAEGVTLTYPGQTAPTLTPAERVMVRQRTRFLVLEAIYKRAHGQCGQPVNACPLFQLLLIDADAVDAAIAYCIAAGYIVRDEASDIDYDWVRLTRVGLDVIEMAILAPQRTFDGMGALEHARTLKAACRQVRRRRKAERQLQREVEARAFLARLGLGADDEDSPNDDTSDGDALNGNAAGDSAPGKHA